MQIKFIKIRQENPHRITGCNNKVINLALFILRCTYLLISELNTVNILPFHNIYKTVISSDITKSVHYHVS